MTTILTHLVGGEQKPLWVFRAVLCLVFLVVEADFCSAGLAVQVKGNDLELINSETGRLLMRLGRPEAGFRAGQGLLNPVQEAMCPAPGKNGSSVISSPDILSPDTGFTPGQGVSESQQKTERTTLAEDISQPGTSLILQEIRQDDKSTVVRFGGNPFFEIWLIFEQINKPKCVRLRVSGKWVGENLKHKGVGAEVWVRVPLEVVGDAIQSVQGFLRERWRCDVCDFALNDGWTTRWGCPAFHFEESRRLMFLPAMSFTTETADSVVVVIDPRSAFGVGATSQKLWFSRKLFILPEAEMLDECIDIKDGLPPAYHDIYLGADEKPSWHELYWDYFLKIFPQFKALPAVTLPSAMSGSVSGFRNRDAERWAKNLYSWGIRLTGFGRTTLGFTEKYLKEVGELDLAEASKLGMKIHVGMDRYASDPKKEAGYGIPTGSQAPEFIWENVKDALIMNAEGKPNDIWSGMLVNMSPEFSYARQVLAVLEQRLHDYHYDGAFVDYYFDGGGYDGTHNYGPYPFYPQLVSESWFMKELSEVVHRNGKYYQINAPAAELISTNRFYDIVSGDVPHKVAISQKLQAVYIPVSYYGNSRVEGHSFTTQGWLQDAFGALIYGSAISPWAFGPSSPDVGTHNLYYLVDVERGRPLFARNGRLMSRLASAALCDGDLVGMTWTAFGHPQGSRYLVTTNKTDTTTDRIIPVAEARLELDDDSHYALIEWDLEKGGRLLSHGIKANELPKTWTVKNLVPHGIKLLCLEPMSGEDVNHLDYFAYIGDQYPWVSSATDEILSAQVVGDPKHACFVIKGYAGVRFEMQFGYPLEAPPTLMQVEGAQEYAVRVEEGVIKVWGTQAGPTVIRFDGSSDKGLALEPKKTLRVTGAFAKAQVIYDSSHTDENDWLFQGGKWSIEDGGLSQRDIQHDWASARLKKHWQGNYQLTFRTAMTHDVENASRPELRFVIGSLEGTDVYIASHKDKYYPFYSFPNLWIGDKVVQRGFDLALYPNQYQRYSRSYHWRVRKQGPLIAMSISYDEGNTYETFMEWCCESDFQPALGISCQHAAMVVDRVCLKQNNL